MTIVADMLSAAVTMREASAGCGETIEYGDGYTDDDTWTDIGGVVTFREESADPEYADAQDAERQVAEATLKCDADAAELAPQPSGHYVRVGGTGGTIWAVVSRQGSVAPRYRLRRVAAQQRGADHGGVT